MPNNLFQELYDLLIDFIQIISSVWDWLYDDLPLIGIRPIDMFGAGILILIGLWTIKSLV